MKWLWLVVLLPNLCPARIVQIDDLVKKDKAYPEGTVIHETTGHMMRPDRMLTADKYKEEAIFRYQFGGVVKEGQKFYVKIVVQNLLRESLIAANRAALNNSKGIAPRSDSIVHSANIELLVPVVNGGATFDFPVRVVTESTVERVEVMEAVLVIQKDRLKILDVADKISPAVNLAWTPPKDWPNDTQTIYLEKASEASSTAPQK